VVLDEVHAIWSGKRGDLLALGLARLQAFAPQMRRVALSATVDDPAKIADWLSPSHLGGEGGRRSRADEGDVRDKLDADRLDQASRSSVSLREPPSPPRVEGIRIVLGDPGAPPVVDVLVSEGRVPWAGHTGIHAIPEVYDAIRRSELSLIFVNTRWQAEFVFQSLWAINEEDLPIALHHGSLAAEQRRKVEAAMARGDLKAVVCTSTLDLGIDWGDVDLVIQLAAPKGARQLGRASCRGRGR